MVVSDVYPTVTTKVAGVVVLPSTDQWRTARGHPIATLKASVLTFRKEAVSSSTRARANYTQPHGFFEVTHRFYLQLIPQAKELAEVDEELMKIEEVENMPEHICKTKGVSREEIQ